jgi:hypothetical protein
VQLLAKVVDNAIDLFLGHAQPSFLTDSTKFELRRSETPSARILFGQAVFVEPGDNNTVAKTDNASTDLVLVSPKLESATWRSKSTQY